MRHFIGCPAQQSLTQNLDGRGLYEDAQGIVAIVTLDIDATLNIDIEHHILASCQLFLNLTPKGAIQSVFIDLLIFQEIAIHDMALELIRR